MARIVLTTVSDQTATVTGLVASPTIKNPVALSVVAERSFVEELALNILNLTELALLPLAPPSTVSDASNTPELSDAADPSDSPMLSSKPSTSLGITQEAIRATREAFEHRVREAEAAEDGLSFDDIVIAHNVTCEQLDNVPDVWLKGMRVELRADGTLLITNLESYQHIGTRTELLVQASAYISSVGDGQVLGATPESPITLDNGEIVRPDVQIYYQSTVLDAPDEPLVLLEVEVKHRLMPDIIRTAAKYLWDKQSVQRVIFLKFYPRRTAARPDQVMVSAIAVVFGRAGNGRIEIIEVRSFGSASVEPSVIDKLVNPDPDGSLVPLPAAINHSAPAIWQPAFYTLAHIKHKLLAVEAGHHRDVLEVIVPGLEEPYPVDLVRGFTRNMLGWANDFVPLARVPAQ